MHDDRGGEEQCFSATAQRKDTMNIAAAQAPSVQHEEAIVDELVARARAAQARFEKGATQERYDMAALAAAWALMQPGRNAELAAMAVETTGLGNVRDKITKNHRKTLGLLRDIRDARTHGIISDDPATGITKRLIRSR